MVGRDRREENATVVGEGGLEDIRHRARGVVVCKLMVSMRTRVQCADLSGQSLVMGKGASRTPLPWLLYFAWSLSMYLLTG